MNQIIDACNAFRSFRVVISGKIPEVIMSEDDAILSVPKSFQTGGGGSTVSVKQFKLKENHGDYLKCISIEDEATLGGMSPTWTFVNIARPPMLRNSLTSRTLDGVAITYSYTSSGSYDTVERTAAASGYNTETHRVIPHYLAAGIVSGTPNSGGDDIWAASASLTIGGDSFNWIDLNVDGRVWSQVPVDPPP